MNPRYSKNNNLFLLYLSPLHCTQHGKNDKGKYFNFVLSLPFSLRASKHNWSLGMSYLHVRALINALSAEIVCLTNFLGCAITRIFLLFDSSEEYSLATYDWALSTSLHADKEVASSVQILFCRCSSPINIAWRLQIAHPRTREFLLNYHTSFCKNESQIRSNY